MPTIGVALAIPEPWAGELQDYRTRLGDVSAAQIPTHITLLPPHWIGDAEWAGIEAHLESASRLSVPFQVRLRGTGTFRPVSPVVFVMLAEGISACEGLAADVRSGPLALPLDFPYHPHVTVAHHLDDDALDRAFEELAHFECVFEAREFHLYAHDETHGWTPRRTFPLGG